MKKILSLLLTASMLLSMVPAVTATEAADPEVPEVIAEEILSPEQAPEATEPPPHFEEAERVYYEVTPETAALDASYVTISGTITLPQAAAQDSYLHVIAIAPPKTDNNGRVFSDPSMDSYGDYVEFSAGQRSANYSMTIPAGSYALGIDNNVAGSGTYLRSFYFNADGSVTFNQYTVTHTTFNSNKVVNLTAPAGEYTISGTLNFSSPAPADTEIRVDLGQNSRHSQWQSQELIVKKGQTSLDYSFAVREGSYYMEFYSDFSDGWLYADLCGELSSEWEDHVYLPCYGDNTTLELVHNGDVLLGEASEGGPTTDTRVEITVNLPAALEKRTEFRTTMILSDSNRNSYSYVEAGATSYTTTIYNPGETFTICYTDTTDCDSHYNYEYSADARYATANGISSQLDDAKTFSADTTSVVVNDRNNYALKGTLKLESPRYYESGMYVMAEFADGDRYAARVFFDADATQNNYTIYVPTRHKNSTYTLWAADTYNSNSNRLLESSYYEGGTYTLSGNASLGNFNIPTPPISLTGTFSLPGGMTAPAGGLAVEIEFDNEHSAIYLLPEGKSSFQYALSPVFDPNDYYSLHAYILNGPDTLTREIYTHDKVSRLNNLTLQAQRAVTVSGMITVPEDCKELGSTIQIYANSSAYDFETERSINCNEYIYVTVLPGQTSAPFSIKAPAGDDVNIRAMVENDATGRLPSNDLYLQQDGTTDTTHASLSLYNDMTDVVFAYVKGKTVSGTITTPISGKYRGYVYLKGLNSNKEYSSSYISFEGTEGTYSVSIPQEDNGERYLLFLEMYDGPEGVLVDTNLYWTPNGMSTAEDENNAFTVPDEGMTVDLSVPRAKTISGSVLISSQLPTDAVYRGQVRIYTEDGSELSDYFDSEDNEMTFNIKLPSDYTGTIKMGMYLYRYDNTPNTVPTYIDLYVAQDGTLTGDKSAAKNFTLSENGLDQNITIYPGRTFTITLNAPAGFSGDYSVRLYLRNLDTNSSTSDTLNFSGTSGSMSYTVPHGQGNYGLEIRTYSGPGLMNKTYYYSNGAWSTDSSSMTPIPMESDNLSLTLPAGKTITGKLVSADGTPVNLGTAENGNSLGSISLSAVNGPYLDYNSSVNADGTFTVTIPDDASGTYRIYFSPYGRPGSNVLRNGSYYYVENATASTTQSSEATPVDVSGTIPELTIFVDTGYVLRGTVKIGEGVTLTSSSQDDYLGSVNIYLREAVESGSYQSYYANVELEKNKTSYEYSMVVPKTANAYSLYISDVYLSDHVTSNMYRGEMPRQTVNISGDGTLPDLLLGKAKAVISATIRTDKLPEYDGVSMDLYVVAGDSVYHTYEYLSSGETITVTVPEAEPSTSYQLYYELYSDVGLDRGPVYVGANGVLTRNEDEAASFSWSTTKHTLNLLEIPPYLTGKIYLPGYTNQTFDIYLNAYSNKYIDVSPSTVKTEEDGRKYVEYGLFYDYIDVGDSFRVYYEVSYSYSTSGTDKLWPEDRRYINADGSFADSRYKADYFEVPESFTTVLDFTLADWVAASSNCILQSVHNIVPSDDPVTYTYTFVYPGITYGSYVYINFNDMTDVDVAINGEYYGWPTTYRSVYTEDGVLTFEMTVSSDEYYEDCYYGFGITSIECDNAYYDSSSSSGCVYSLSGSSEEAVMADLNAGKTIYVAQVSNYDTSASTYAAIYDSNGKFLDIAIVPMDFSDSTVDCIPVTFDTGYADAAYLKVMLLDDSGFTPLNLASTIGN